jgi:thiol-disulfide isomerase/thioredoxin
LKGEISPFFITVFSSVLSGSVASQPFEQNSPFLVYTNKRQNVRKIQLLMAILFIVTTLSVSAQKVEYIKIPELEKILKYPDDKLYVVNFWATWCAPCVSEIPVFQKTAKEYDTSKVRFILVSLDFPSQIEKQLIPFLKKNRVTLDVAVMMDVDYNAWIDKVDLSWQGDIPATLFFNNSRKSRYFHTGELTESELKKHVNLLL